ncbi:bifunctional helix-turn-helix transcriptional regulator/GNAT family N-acetyltransferase [Oceanibacterium hippocampi]|uniref:Putative acetyltransferase n=1 Tax=Oceanibacterium hippocampi TaxID=745714 RepID=A0A1Y5T1I8_9PROT|nr:helix-turn-helix domain-containing GNAT family N-acetyltransferase [Oceanibacterium hippocampi]SLN50066.1 putative acetyltransferase [Oceanibacterium hippocampi]
MTGEPNHQAESAVDRIRRFNRFYTRQVGALDEGLQGTSFTLTETRVLYELAHSPDISASALAAGLRLDPAYLSRILRSFRERGLVAGTPSAEDGRRVLLSLTEQGWRTFRPLEEKTKTDIGRLLETIPDADQVRLLDAMATIETVLGAGATGGTDPSVVLRPHRIGDMGWVIHRHAALYSEEYDWDGSFEIMVAEIAAQFLREFDPEKESCWIAEIDGRIAGSVFVVRKDGGTAQLRLLYVEPWARGRGVGQRLVTEAVDFARRTGYRRMMLWTNDILHAARRIYEDKGFRLVEENRHESFGKTLIGQVWDLEL